MGLNPDDRVISFSDYSHVSLYLMDQKGWTRFIDMRLHRGEPIPYNNDSIAIQQSINNGAKYLILNGLDDLYNNKYINGFTKNLKSVYRNLLIFDLINQSKNFEIDEKTLKSEFLCSAEIITDDGKFFIDKNGPLIFKNIETRTNEISLMGEYSVKLNDSNPYGMTCELDSMHFGEHIEITVWKKGADSNGMIVAQAADFNQFNRSGGNPTGRKKDEWVEIGLKFFVPYHMHNKSIKIYIYQFSSMDVYFDDLVIKNYHSLLKDKP
jgi:hypothetical protein